MTLAEFNKKRFIINLLSWVAALWARASFATGGELSSWAGTCAAAVIAVFILNRYVIADSKTPQSDDTVIDSSSVENAMKTVVLALPIILSAYYVMSLFFLNARVEKMSWVPVVLSLYMGVILEEYFSNKKKN